MADHERRQDGSPENISFALEAINVEQRWMGIVESIEDDELSVVLNNPATEEEEFTTIDKSQLSERDQERIADGAAFEWVIGYVDDTSGRRIGVSIIELAQPQTLTDEEKQEALRAGDEISQALIAGESDRRTFD